MTRELLALVGREAYVYQDDPTFDAGPIGARSVARIGLPIRASIRQDIDGDPVFFLTVLATEPSDRNPFAVLAQFQWERKAFDDQWSLLSVRTRSDYGIVRTRALLRPTTFGRAIYALKALADRA